MSKGTRNILRLLSVLIVLAIVLMELDIIPQVFNFRFWFMVGAYALMLFTLQR